MSEPTIKGRLESSLFTANPALVQSKLDDCLALDPKHITPGSKGGHVELIQSALGTIRKTSPSIPAITDADGDYGPTTRKAVLEYKRLNGIKRAGQPLDDIVGRMTLSKLDDDMKAPATPPPTPTDPPPTPDPATKTVDVIVRYIGDRISAELQPDEVISNGLLGAYNKKTNRELVRFGNKTNTFGAALTATIDAHVKKVEASFTGKKKGSVLVIGSSSGGRNALNLAIKLSAKGFTLAFVGIIDTAWFPNEATNSPSVNPLSNKTVPLFPAGGTINANQTLDAFQIAGNRTEISFSSGKLIFSSKMDNKEIHGLVSTFTKRDITSEVEAKKPGGDGDAHDEGGKIGTPIVLTAAAGVLNTLPS